MQKSCTYIDILVNWIKINYWTQKTYPIFSHIGMCSSGIAEATGHAHCVPPYVPTNRVTFPRSSQKGHLTQGSRVSITNWSKSNTNHLTNHQHNLPLGYWKISKTFYVDIKKSEVMLYWLNSSLYKLGFLFFYLYLYCVVAGFRQNWTVIEEYWAVWINTRWMAACWKLIISFVMFWCAYACGGLIR